VVIMAPSSPSFAQRVSAGNTVISTVPARETAAGEPVVAYRRRDYQHGAKQIDQDAHETKHESFIWGLIGVCTTVRN
ncbi:hypothetical protein, partial [Mycobacterium sp. 852014-52144_SCH5372336]|uniref:hypothetical protein n=1 Tax=Mycobacterium sp. 852014-52144_SCH5372336 TaxID=1834115 RepID=UPI001E2EEAD8